MHSGNYGAGHSPAFSDRKNRGPVWNMATSRWLTIGEIFETPLITGEFNGSMVLAIAPS